MQGDFDSHQPDPFSNRTTTTRNPCLARSVPSCRPHPGAAYLEACGWSQRGDGVCAESTSQLGVAAPAIGATLSQEDLDGTILSARMLIERTHDQLFGPVLPIKDEPED